MSTTISKLFSGDLVIGDELHGRFEDAVSFNGEAALTTTMRSS
jgi:hypothetical protein